MGDRRRGSMWTRPLHPGVAFALLTAPFLAVLLGWLAWREIAGRAVGALFSEAWAPPTDDQVRARFEAHASEFEELREIMVSFPRPYLYVGRQGSFCTYERAKSPVGDVWEMRPQGDLWVDQSGHSVSRAGTLRAAGLAEESYERIVELLRRIDSECAWRESIEGRTVVFFWGRGGRGGAKSIVFAEPDPSPIVPRTDCPEVWQGNRDAYASLGPKGWFIQAEQ